MIVVAEKILEYNRGSLNAGTLGIVYLKSLITGTIESFRIDVGASFTAGNCKFDVRINGVSQFTSMTWPTIANGGAKSITVTGLSIAINVGDVIQLDVIDAPTGGAGVPFPVTFFVFTEDGVTNAVPAGGSTGDVLTKASGADGDFDWEAPSGGGGGASIISAPTITTSSIANNTEDTGSISLATVAIILRVVVDHNARIRLYQTAAAQTADVARTFGSGPYPQGLIMDILLDGTTGLDVPMTPPVLCVNGDGPRTADIYWSVENVSGSTHVLTVDMDAVELVA